MIGWTLGRYFFLRYVKTTIYFLLGIFILSLLIDFTINAGRLAGLPGYSPFGALAISALRIPFNMQQLFPFVALFSAMATLIALNRKMELVVTRSIGVSAWQFLTPLCFGAFLFGLFGVIVVNPIAAWGTSQSEKILSEWKGKNIETTVDNERIPWLTQRTDYGVTTIGTKATADGGLTLLDATFVEYNDDETIKDWLNATRAHLTHGYWVLESGARYRASHEPENYTELKVPTNLRPEFVEEKLADPASIPFYDLPRKIEIARSFGYSANSFDMQLQSLIALPALLIAMTLIAATVTLKFVRFGQSRTMILGGIIAGFVLYVVTVLVQAFGKAAYVPPVIAAWVPVVIALFFGISFLLHKEDG
ncbi:LPS export ABC transporter permease LptG [Bartonella sp. W8098]|uniref:LPS export ABC transporter permease LptG n=1 Tax=Bartonella TaxID=773 RepID=UPI0018DD4ECE|nr:MULTISPECIES: LPS export ABC transporter permease LptG [Bartonella]MBH9987778.1 LPS export ABC transporter permease LptG [Bartonella apis]MBI0172145.1 LPS export ABC transporter permease LptG [Bartonella sp. W8151]